MKQFVASLVIALLVTSGVAFPQDKARTVQFLGQEWKVSFPDAVSGVTQFQDPNWIGLMNRVYISRPWKGGEIEFVWAHLLTKPMTEVKQNISYADHLVIGLRTDGANAPKRSFELKGTLILRIRSGSGEFRLEDPSKAEAGNELIKSVSLKESDEKFGLEPGKFHRIKIVDKDGKITVSCNGKEVLSYTGAAAPADGNQIVIGNRETNGGMNISILAPAK